MDLIKAAEASLAQAIQKTSENPEATTSDWARTLGATLIDFSAYLPGLPPEFRKKLSDLGFAAVKANQ